MDNLLSELEAGIMPHYMIPRTLGAMANANVYGVVPYLKDIFNNILPLLGGLRNDALKQSFSFGKYKKCVIMSLTFLLVFTEELVVSIFLLQVTTKI